MHEAEYPQTELELQPRMLFPRLNALVPSMGKERKEKISDATLVGVVDEMDKGLIDADLGGHVFNL